MRHRLALVIAACLLALAGCGGDEGDDARTALDETARKLGQIRSGELSLSMRLDGRGAKAEAPVGFELDGPFALAREGGLPVARLRYTQIAGEGRGTATFISTGEDAFVEVAGKAYELDDAQARELVGRAAGGEGGKGGLGGLDLSSWVRKPKLVGTEQRDGVETDHLTAELDAVRALQELGGLAGAVGADAGRLDRETAERIRDAVRDAKVDVWTGREDRLLRRLELSASLELDVPEQVREALGDLVGGDLSVSVQVGKLNRPVTVDAPADPQPASALPQG